MNHILTSPTGLSYKREAKLLCKKTVAFFSQLSKQQEQDNKNGVTPELLSLVTGLAHYLKLLIRICLQGALRIETERSSSVGLFEFLENLGTLESFRGEDEMAQITGGMSRLSANDSDQCTQCRKPIEDEGAKSGDLRFHLACVGCVRCGKSLSGNLQDARISPYDYKILCSNCEPRAAPAQPFERVSTLQQYVFLLKVAHARMLEILRSHGVLPYASENATSNGFDGGEVQKVSSEGDAPHLRSDVRSKSYAGEKEHHRESSYESTLNDIRRLRSTRRTAGYFG